MTRGRVALTVVLITTGALTAGCTDGHQAPSAAYRQEIRTCDGLPDVADRTTCWVDALRREQARRHGRTAP